MEILAKDICMGCDHFCDNNDDGLTIGCRAFPDGILNKIGLKHSHDAVIEGQVGDYVYTPSKRKFDRFGSKMIVFQ